MAAYSTTPNQKPPKIASVYRTGAAITPTDNTAIGPYEGFYVGSGGTIAVIPSGQTSVLNMTVQDGSYHPLEIQGVNATGTTSTGIIGLG